VTRSDLTAALDLYRRTPSTTTPHRGYTLTGTHEGEFQGIAATGRKVEVRGVQIGRFENAQIVERWGSTDELAIMSQLGAEPKQSLGDKMAGKLKG